MAGIAFHGISAHVTERFHPHLVANGINKCKMLTKKRRAAEIDESGRNSVNHVNNPFFPRRRHIHRIVQILHRAPIVDFYLVIARSPMTLEDNITDPGALAVERINKGKALFPGSSIERVPCIIYLMIERLRGHGIFGQINMAPTVVAYFMSHGIGAKYLVPTAAGLVAGRKGGNGLGVGRKRASYDNGERSFNVVKIQNGYGTIELIADIIVEGVRYRALSVAGVPGYFNGIGKRSALDFDNK
jgi:hypothetical protein